jgi:hypothetical protein
MNKYEQLIEFIINEQEDKARELFHQIVVEKSREIYENLIDETDIETQPVAEIGDDVQADEEGMVEADDEMGMDADMEMDADMDDMGGEEGEEDGMDMDDMGGEEGGLEDRVMDLEAALDELKAEFDALMSDEMEEPEHADMAMPGEEPKEETFDPSMVREYVDKVAAPANQEGHTVGTGASDKPGTNAKSIVAGKNDMGGTAGNIVKGGAEQAADGKPTPKPSNQYTKGQGNLPGAGSFENVPGAKTKGYTNKAGSSKPEGATTHGNMPVQKHSIVAK